MQGVVDTRIVSDDGAGTQQLHREMQVPYKAAFTAGHTKVVVETTNNARRLQVCLLPKKAAFLWALGRTVFQSPGGFKTLNCCANR